MSKLRHTGLVALLLSLGFTASVVGQFPAPPPAPGVPAIPAAPAAPTAAQAATAAQGAQPQNIWSKICLTPDQKKACKDHLCSCGLVQMVEAMLKPVSLMTGGLIKGFCPTPDQANPDDLAKPADSASGAAARIKADEADAKARRADVRYLGTVDCSRYPEAEGALINALRTDRNECVRLEAAIVLGSGCCCTKKTVEALRLTASGSDKDGNPKESSPRVRCAAADSLGTCELKVDSTPEPPEKLPLPAEKATFLLPQGSTTILTSFLNPLPTTPEPPMAPLAPSMPEPPAVRPRPVAPAPVQTTAQSPQRPSPNAESRRIPTGDQSLFGVLSRQFKK